MEGKIKNWFSLRILQEPRIWILCDNQDVIHNLDEITRKQWIGNEGNPRIEKKNWIENPKVEDFKFNYRQKIKTRFQHTKEIETSKMMNLMQEPTEIQQVNF